MTSAPTPRRAGALVPALLGAVTAQAVSVSLRRVRVTALTRTNYRGVPVDLAAGPALAAGATVGAALCAPRCTGAPRSAVLALGLGAGALGLLDDLLGDGRCGSQRDAGAASGLAPPAPAKGFVGHLRALRAGRVTTGALKLVGITAAGVLAGWAQGRAQDRHGARLLAEAAVTGGVVAGSANLINLLDLRPGRALKVVLALTAPLLWAGAGGTVTGPAAAAVVLLPDDLAERVMIGDCGANAVGALVGLGASSVTATSGRMGLLGVLIGLNALSERVSFSAVIARTRWLRRLDELGRVGGR